MIAVPTGLVALAGVSSSLAGGPASGVTVKVALELANPADDTVTVAVPVNVGVRCDTARPLFAVMGGTGLNVPVTPVTANTISLVAVVTVLPAAS